jgi:pimeloyl-ACP methyl ester carboxylesterase
VDPCSSPAIAAALFAPAPSSRRGRLRAHARAAGLLAHTIDLPGTRRLADSVAEIEEGALGGRPCVVVRPRTAPPWPAILFVNGATPDGRAHPGVRRFAIALARAGHVVFVPDLPGIASGELLPQTLAAAVECATGGADAAETCAGRIGLVGVSIGGTLALLVAAAPELAARISVVAAIAPFTDLEKVMMLATTGMYRGAGGPEPYPVPPSLAVGLARSLVATLPSTPDARALALALDRLDPLAPDPLHALRESPCRSLGPDAATAQALLLNRDPSRFADLYAALPGDVQRVVGTLSPVRSAARLTAPVEIATAPHDKYFPLAESLALQREARQVRITVTSALAHATPRMSLGNLVAFVRLESFFARSLGAAS